MKKKKKLETEPPLDNDDDASVSSLLKPHAVSIHVADWSIYPTFPTLESHDTFWIRCNTDYGTMTIKNELLLLSKQEQLHNNDDNDDDHDANTGKGRRDDRGDENGSDPSTTKSSLPILFYGDQSYIHDGGSYYLFFSLSLNDSVPTCCLRISRKHTAKIKEEYDDDADGDNDDAKDDDEKEYAIMSSDQKTWIPLHVGSKKATKATSSSTTTTTRRIKMDPSTGYNLYMCVYKNELDAYQPIYRVTDRIHSDSREHLELMKQIHRDALFLPYIKNVEMLVSSHSFSTPLSDDHMDELVRLVPGLVDASTT